MCYLRYLCIEHSKIVKYKLHLYDPSSKIQKRGPPLRHGVTPSWVYTPLDTESSRFRLLQPRKRIAYGMDKTVSIQQIDVIFKILTVQNGEPQRTLCCRTWW